MTTIDNIELHDSSVIADESGCSELLLHLRPAYLHHWEYTSGGWHGVGRSQDATIRIAGGVVSPRVPADGRVISDGWFRVANETYDNLIPVPLARVGTVVAHLTLVDAAAVDITGAALSVELSGGARALVLLAYGAVGVAVQFLYDNRHPLALYFFGGALLGGLFLLRVRFVKPNSAVPADAAKRPPRG